MILILHEPATQAQVEELLQTLGAYIKLAVDVERGILAAGGELHVDCEQALLAAGSHQEDVWGTDWDPAGEVRFESLINIRPQQGNCGLDRGRRSYVGASSRSSGASSRGVEPCWIGDVWLRATAG